jgi:hypothetical protein
VLPSGTISSSAFVSASRLTTGSIFLIPYSQHSPPSSHPFGWQAISDSVVAFMTRTLHISILFVSSQRLRQRGSVELYRKTRSS